MKKNTLLTKGILGILCENLKQCHYYIKDNIAIFGERIKESRATLSFRLAFILSLNAQKGSQTLSQR